MTLHNIFIFQTTGIFGWVTSHDLFWIIVLFAFLIGFLGFLGKTIALRSLSAVVYSTFQLMDPAMTGWMAWMAGGLYKIEVDEWLWSYYLYFT